MHSIAIVGAGALGLYYGGRMVRAGRDVRFLARGDLAPLRTRGIELTYGGARHETGPVAAFDAP